MYFKGYSALAQGLTSLESSLNQLRVKVLAEEGDLSRRMGDLEPCGSQHIVTSRRSKPSRIALSEANPLTTETASSRGPPLGWRRGLVGIRRPLLWAPSIFHNSPADKP